MSCRLCSWWALPSWSSPPPSRRGMSPFRGLRALPVVGPGLCPCSPGCALRGRGRLGKSSMLLGSEWPLSTSRRLCCCAGAFRGRVVPFVGCRLCLWSGSGFARAHPVTLGRGGGRPCRSGMLLGSEWLCHFAAAVLLCGGVSVGFACRPDCGESGKLGLLGRLRSDAIWVSPPWRMLR